MRRFGMFGIVLFDLLFFGIPAILIALFGISVYRYVSAVKQNKEIPGTFSPEEIKKRRIALIVFSVAAGVLAAVVIGFVWLLFMAVAFM